MFPEIGSQYQFINELGRGGTGVVKFPAGDRRFSRYHAELVLVDGDWWLFDESARADKRKRGTWVDGTWLKGTGKKLEPGSRISFGDDVPEFFALFTLDDCEPTVRIESVQVEPGIVVQAAAKSFKAADHRRLLTLLGSAAGVMIAFVIDFIKQLLRD
jgi:pSer/pThr/pTyr-binding forkhead associated (FHA) protein